MVFLQDELEPVGSAAASALKADFVLLYRGPGVSSPDTMQLFSFCQHCSPSASCRCHGKHPRAGVALSCSRWEQTADVTSAISQPRLVQVKGGEAPEVGKELRNLPLLSH